MYSRKFTEQPLVPPNYSGIAYPHGEQTMLPSEDPIRRPRRPLYQADALPERKNRRASTAEAIGKDGEKAPQQGIDRPEKDPVAFRSRRFSMEDILLAGLVLLLLTGDGSGTDTDLLLLLGFLLIAGL